MGSFAPNGFGLYDMHGNVDEWVADCWHESYEGAPTDGSARTTGCDRDPALIYSELAVVRGGAWLSYPQDLRAASRIRYEPSYRNVDNGFRLVQDLNP